MDAQKIFQIIASMQTTLKQETSQLHTPAAAQSLILSEARKIDLRQNSAHLSGSIASRQQSRDQRARRCTRAALPAIASRLSHAQRPNVSNTAQPTAFENRVSSIPRKRRHLFMIE